MLHMGHAESVIFAEGCCGMAAKNTHTKAPWFEVSTKEAICTFPETNITNILILIKNEGCKNTLQGTKISPTSPHFWVNDFPFPQVGHVSFLRVPPPEI